MPSPEETKYTRVEYERRFLVLAGFDWRSVIEPHSKTFDDKYIKDSRLRLRIVTDSDTGRRLFKLNKKDESPSPYYRTISRVLLSPIEHELLNKLEGDCLRKIRHYHHCLGRVFSIDVFERELEGLVLCETESDSLEDLMLAQPPPFASVEVTTDSFFEGSNLCRTTRAELMSKLALFG